MVNKSVALLGDNKCNTLPLLTKKLIGTVIILIYYIIINYNNGWIL